MHYPYLGRKRWLVRNRGIGFPRWFYKNVLGTYRCFILYFVQCRYERLVRRRTRLNNFLSVFSGMYCFIHNNLSSFYIVHTVTYYTIKHSPNDHVFFFFKFLFRKFSQLKPIRLGRLVMRAPHSYIVDHGPRQRVMWTPNVLLIFTLIFITVFCYITNNKRVYILNT